MANVIFVPKNLHFQIVNSDLVVAVIVLRSAVSDRGSVGIDRAHSFEDRLRIAAIAECPSSDRFVLVDNYYNSSDLASDYRIRSVIQRS